MEVECSASPVIGRPSVNMVGLGEEEGWGGALAFFGFLGPESEAKAETIEPLGSSRFDAFLFAFPKFRLCAGSEGSGVAWRRGERRGWESIPGASTEGGRSSLSSLSRLPPCFCPFALTFAAAGFFRFSSLSPSLWGEHACLFCALVQGGLWEELGEEDA